MQPSPPLALVVCLLALTAGCGGPAAPATETRSAGTIDAAPADGGVASGTAAATARSTATARPATVRRATAPTPTWTVRVAAVVDGDTMDVRFANGTTERVRLLGVDTPEVHGEPDPAEFEGIPTTEAGRAWLDAWGEDAGEFARTALAGETVRMSLDPRADRRGGYGRLLVYLAADGQSFNRRLLAEGYARFYAGPLARAETFAAVEARARERGVGLWDYPRERVPARLGRRHAA